ncbi:uncharacterized protein LOC135485508 [Lineus longissimus]|uniref:uncharacterized protein LOC135485508 n=1 Tax=Lineus longissimus TaxID=88925 RepID=UPI002B4D0EBB
MNQSNFLSSVTPTSIDNNSPRDNPPSTSAGYTFMTSGLSDGLPQNMFQSDEASYYEDMGEESSSQEMKKEGINWSSNSPPFVNYSGAIPNTTSSQMGNPMSDTPIPTTFCGPDVPNSGFSNTTCVLNDTMEYEDSHSSASLCDQRARFLRTAQALKDSGLIGVTVHLAKILKENEDAQGELQQLKEETRNFLIDVLNNPENTDLRPFFEAKGFIPPRT